MTPLARESVPVWRNLCARTGSISPYAQRLQIAEPVRNAVNLLISALVSVSPKDSARVAAETAKAKVETQKVGKSVTVSQTMLDALQREDQAVTAALARPVSSTRPVLL